MPRRLFIPRSRASASTVDAVELVERILAAALARGASDVHIEPTADGAEVRFRVDGLLEVYSRHDHETGRCIVARLMVLAQLLTYRLDIPQEGRLRLKMPLAESPAQADSSACPADPEDRTVHPQPHQPCAPSPSGGTPAEGTVPRKPGQPCTPSSSGGTPAEGRLHQQPGQPCAPSPSPGTPGEGRGEGSFSTGGHLSTSRENHHHNPLPEHQERGPKPQTLEMRLSIMPTTHGLRAAVRMPAELIQPHTLEELCLPQPVLCGLKSFAAVASGMLLVTGPAGAGKTTTIYALLDLIARSSPGVSIVAIEDPVERDIPGVTQIEVSPFGQLTYERALRSVVRQDPQVLMLGEIRDAATASLAAQAALSGHRLICTMHAGTPGGAIARLLEMGLEPYRITSTLFGVISQRLLRKLNTDASANAGGRQSGHYRGRIPAAEFVPLSAALRRAILAGADAAELQRVAATQPGYVSLHRCAQVLVAQGLTDIDEVNRVLGPEDQTQP